ncbi:MAG: carbohydrate porin [Candidatus Omnitrophota bacterium]
MYRKLLPLMFFLLATTAAHGADENSTENLPFLESLFSRQTATGNWHGLRNRLVDRGISISSNYTTDIGGNPVGGIKQTAKYSGFLNLGVVLDFETIAGLKGCSLTVTNYLASGRNLSAAIGNFYGVQEIYAPGNYFFGELDLSLSLLDETLTIETGRLFAGDVFATSPLWQYYVSGGINNNLNSMPTNIFFPSFDIAAWAARATYQPTEAWQFIAGIYNADTRVQKINNRGAYLSFAMDNGYLAIGQLTYKHHQSHGNEGLPGSATFGSYYQSSKVQDLTDSDKWWHGNYGYYFIADQMIYRGDWPEYAADPEDVNPGHGRQPYFPQAATAANRPKDLTAWAGAYVAPQERTNSQVYQLVGGLLYQGLPPNRNRDVTAFCILMGKFSDKLEGQDMEIVLELNHRFQISQWFYITPDIQYVINPNGQDNIDDALVLGVEISVNF